MEKQVKTRMLIYGYGNPAHQDDGIGVTCAECIDRWAKNENLNVTIQVEWNERLNVADAENMADKDIVIFIDSSRENIRDFYLSKVAPSEAAPEGPSYLLFMCNKMYGRHPVAFALHIRGYRWKEDKPFSDKAECNLCKALEYLKEKIRNPEILLNAATEKCSIDL